MYTLTMVHIDRMMTWPFRTVSEALRELGALAVEAQNLAGEPAQWRGDGLRFDCGDVWARVDLV